MKRHPSSASSAFTLIEIVMAMVVILVLTGIVISIAGFVQNRSNRTRAEGDIKMLETAMSGYLGDCGRYPQDIPADLAVDGVTDKLNPKTDFIPKGSGYEKANLFLYKELTGDREGPANGEPDGIPEAGTKAYWADRQPNSLKVELDANRKIIRVRYIQDPWGDPYGYSTVGMSAEQKYQRKLKAGETVVRPGGADAPGFGTSSPDLWSAGNNRPAAEPTSPAEKMKLWAKWIKNW
jgi:type II secretory pathway pseudopilin PulG